MEGVPACGRGLEVGKLEGSFQPKPFWDHSQTLKILSAVRRCWSIEYSLPNPVERLGQQRKPAGASFRGNPQEEMDLLGGSRPGCFLLKHMVSTESSLNKLLDVETFWSLLSKQTERVGKYS